MGRRKNIQWIDQNMLQQSRSRFFSQPICDEYLGSTTFQQGTRMDGCDNDADLHQTIADIMKKRKLHSVDQARVSNQAESSSCKKPRLFVGALQQFLPFRDSMSHEDDSSDDEAEESIHRIISGVRAGSFGQASYQQNRADVVVEYKDCGDGEYTCNYCAAYFLLDEALKIK